MSNPTEREKAESFNLWCEYIDPQAAMSRDQFDAMTVDERLSMIHDVFGCDDSCEA